MTQLVFRCSPWRLQPLNWDKVIICEPWRSVPNFLQSNNCLDFSLKPKMSTHGCIRDNKFNLKTIHPKVVEIFWSGLKWRTNPKDRQTDVQSYATRMAKVIESCHSSAIHYTVHLPCLLYRYIIHCVQIHPSAEGGGLLVRSPGNWGLRRGIVCSLTHSVYLHVCV